MKTSQIHGQGVFANKDFCKGSRIAFFEGYETENNSMFSLTFGSKYIEPTGDLKHLNHSCDPNAFFLDRWLHAKTDIALGEEITIDYQAIESGISHHFMCNCETENCRGYL